MKEGDCQFGLFASCAPRNSPTYFYVDRLPGQYDACTSFMAAQACLSHQGIVEMISIYSWIVEERVPDF